MTGQHEQRNPVPGPPQPAARPYPEVNPARLTLGWRHAERPRSMSMRTATDRCRGPAAAASSGPAS